MPHDDDGFDEFDFAFRPPEQHDDELCDLPLRTAAAGPDDTWDDADLEPRNPDIRQSPESATPADGFERSAS